jgi:hypothetical protein
VRKKENDTVSPDRHSTSHDQETAQADGSNTDAAATRVVGLVTDPDFPTRVGSQLSPYLTDWLRRKTGEAWTVEVVSDPLAANEFDSAEILDKLEDYLPSRQWDYAICLTDLPMLRESGPLLADANTQSRVALVSLPALGGLQPYRRMRQMLTQLLHHLLDGPQGSSLRDADNHRLSSSLTKLVAPVRRSSPPERNIDVRYGAPRRRGWMRLVSGMVRTNSPWRLLSGLSGAVAAALAAAGFGLVTSTVWQLGDAMGWRRALGATVFSVGLMTVWLIAGHHLWERVGRRAVRDRRLAVLYNASTVATLGIGVACLYLLVFVVTIAAAACLLEASVLEQMVKHAVGWSTYARLAWMVASMALVAGALGSGLESDAAVRQAAYGYREKQRRAEHGDAGEE